MRYYRIESESKSSYRIIVSSLVITLCIFLFLPFLEFLVKQKKALSLREIETVTIKKLPPKEFKAKKREKKKLPRPKLARAKRRLVPLQIATSLGLGIDSTLGDFALSFDRAPTLLAQDLVFELSEVDTPPQAIVRISPLYPITAKLKGIEGKVELIFIVRVDGSVDNVEVKSSTPAGIFEDAAIRTVRKWRFKPGAKGGRPVATRVLLPLRFELEKWER